MHESFGGEAILSIGKAIDYILRGASGIASIAPFTCMPGTVVAALSKQVQKDFNNIPWINLFYDGQQEDITTQTRIEAFMFQAKTFNPCRNGNVERDQKVFAKYADFPHNTSQTVS